MSLIAIRHATPADLDAIADAEARSFPAAEACSRASFERRLTRYPDHFWLLEVIVEGAGAGDAARPGDATGEEGSRGDVGAGGTDESETRGVCDGAPLPPRPRLASFVNGLVTETPDLLDEMYDDPSWHDQFGAWQMIFGVVTAPAYRRRGYAGMLLERVIADARRQGRAGLVLTCKDALLPYYAKFGFVDEGPSASQHGGVAWHQMRLTL